MSSNRSKLTRPKRRRDAVYQRGYQDALVSVKTALSDQKPVAWLRHGEETFVQNVPFGAMWISDKDDPRAFPVYDRPQQPAPSVAVKDLEWDCYYPEPIKKGEERICGGRRFVARQDIEAGSHTNAPQYSGLWEEVE